MMKYPVLVGSLFLIIFVSVAYGSICYGDEEKDFSGLQFMKQIEQNEKTKGDPLLLFSNIHILGTHSGNIYIFKGNMKVSGTIEGDIYAYGSEIYIGQEAIIKGDVKTVSSEVAYHQNAQIDRAIEPIMATLNVFKKQWNETLFSHYTDNIPSFILEMIKTVVQMLISLLFLSLFRKTVILEGNFLINQTKDVFYNGFLIYLMDVALILIFTLSLVGFPFAIFLLLFSWIFSGLGEAALSVIIGERIIRTFHVQNDIYIKFWLGLAMLQLIKNTPLIGLISSITIIPFLSLGMFAQVLINKIINPAPVLIKEERENEINPYQQEKLYEIITKDLRAKGRK